MAAKVMSESEFESVSIGDKVIFYKKPIEHLHLYRNLTELKEYTVKGKYYQDPHGPVLETFTILGDDMRPVRLHRSFFLSKDSAIR